LIEPSEVQKDCLLLEKYQNKLKYLLSFSRVEHAFDISCYNQNALDNLIVLKELDDYLSQLADKKGYNIYYFFYRTGHTKATKQKSLNWLMD